MRSLLKKVEWKSSTIRPKFLRLISLLMIISYILGYFYARWDGRDELIDMMSVDTSSGVFWFIIIIVLLGYVDYFIDIIKDIARSKVSEFAASDYYKNSVSLLIEDKLFKRSVRDIVNDYRETGFVSGDLTTSGNKINEGENECSPNN